MAIRLIVRPPGGHEPSSLTFDQQRVRIGRGTGSDLRLPHAAVSVEHAMVLLDGDRYFVVDVGSTNGTTLGGEQLIIHRRKLLRSGDVIDIAGFQIEFAAGVPMLSHHSQERTLAATRQLTHGLMLAEDRSLSRPALVVTNGPQEGERFDLDDPPGQMVIGRATECEIVLVDREASRQHAAIDITAEGVVARDVSGVNPLQVNGKETNKQRLHDRDELLVGSTTLVFDDPVEAYLRDLAQWPENECAAPMKVVDAVESPEPPDDLETSSPKTVLSEDMDDEGGGDGESASAESAAESTSGPVLAPEEDGPSARRSRAGGEGAGAVVDPSVGTPLAEPVSNRPLVVSKSSSAGSEIAILLVGAIALVACVVALIWIFR